MRTLLFCAACLACPVAAFLPAQATTRLPSRSFHALSTPSFASSRRYVKVKMCTSETDDLTKDPAAKKPVKGPLQSVKRFFAGDAINRKRLADMGLAAVLSYGWVSNASYSVCVSVAWFLASKRSGLSPLAPGQWQFFLGAYGGMFALNNVVRPLRFALSVAITPAFDKLIATVMARTGLSKAASTGVVVFCVNVLGTITLMSGGVLLASLLSGVPLWATAA